MTIEHLDNDTKLITLPAADLHNALANSILFASTDDSIPVLNAVYFQYKSAQKTLVAWATDRYQLVTIKVADNIESDLDDFEFLISVDDIKAMTTTLRGYKKFSDPDIQLEITDEKIELIYFQDIERTQVVPHTPGQYPKIGSLLTNALDGEVKTPGFNNALLSLDAFNQKFIENTAKLKDRRTRSRQDSMLYGIVGTTHDKNTQKLIFWKGDWAVGLLMPIRIDRTEHTPTLPSWVH